VMSCRPILWSSHAAGMGRVGRLTGS
jgi:hypothetical protein